MHRNVQNNKYSEIQVKYKLSPLVITVNY